MAVSSRWLDSAAAVGLRTPPARETGMGSVGLAVAVAVAVPPAAAVADVEAVISAVPDELAVEVEKEELMEVEVTATSVEEDTSVAEATGAVVEPPWAPNKDAEDVIVTVRVRVR